MKSPEYSWNSAGIYTVSLTVEDGEGQETTSTKNIEVKSLGPVASFTFSSGEKIDRMTILRLMPVIPPLWEHRLKNTNGTSEMEKK